MRQKIEDKVKRLEQENRVARDLLKNSKRNTCELLRHINIFNSFLVDLKKAINRMEKQEKRMVEQSQRRKKEKKGTRKRK